MRKICILIFLITSIFSSKVLATSFDDLSANISKDYLEWLEAEDKESTIMPRMYEVVSDYENPDIHSNKLKDSLFGKTDDILKTSSVENISRYFLGDEISLRVKNQKSTTECWAFSILSSLESNMAKTRNLNNLDFSERHMDYATSRTFLDNQVNEVGFKRELGGGGTPDIALAYLTSGLGPIKEESMPFIDSEEKISLSEISFPEAETKVNSYVSFKSILKEQKNGKTYYYDKSGNGLSNSEVTAIRNKIKTHILKYGAISGFTAGTQYQFYSNPENFIQSEAYYCDTLNVKYDHAITIVGWDDNYSKENFNENHRPTSDGAYIVLNSYGTQSFDNGYIYISYEDAYIEYYLYGITSTEDANYDYIYQYDPYGCVSAIGSTAYDYGYGANVFTRNDISEEEYLTDVSVNLVTKSSIEVYINPDGADLNNLIKVGEKKVSLEPGYHTIEFEPVKLTGEKFAVVVKYINAGEGFYFGAENKLNGTIYEYASAKSEQSFLSFDGKEWSDLTTLRIQGLDMSTANICIKAFSVVGNSNNPEDDKVVSPEETPEETPEEIPEEVPEETPEEIPEVKPDEDDKEEIEEPDKNDGEIIIDTENNNEEETKEKNESTVIITVNNKDTSKEETNPEEDKEITEEKPKEENKTEDTKEEKPEEVVNPDDSKNEENTKDESNEEPEKNIATIVIEVNKGKDDIAKEEDKQENKPETDSSEDRNSANIIVTVGNSKNIFSNWYNVLRNSKENYVANENNEMFRLNSLLKLFVSNFKR